MTKLSIQDVVRYYIKNAEKTAKRYQLLSEILECFPITDIQRYLTRKFTPDPNNMNEIDKQIYQYQKTMTVLDKKEYDMTKTLIIPLQTTLNTLIEQKNQFLAKTLHYIRFLRWGTFIFQIRHKQREIDQLMQQLKTLELKIMNNPVVWLDVIKNDQTV